MVSTTNIAIEREEQRTVAIQIAVEVGLLRRCEKHGTVFDTMDDFLLDDAFRYGQTLMADNDPTMAIFQGNRKRWRHVIDEVRSGMPNCCSDCYYASRSK